MQKKSKFLLYITLNILGFAAIGDLCQKQTKGFRAQNLIPSCSNEVEAKFLIELSSQEKKEIESMLSQPFYFLKKGQQCFTFLSKDNQYVLKLFRWEKLEAPFWTKLVPKKFTTDLINDKNKKKELDFTSYELAYKELKEETALIYLQLDKNSPLDSLLEIYDNLNIRHTLSTKKTGFILQKKAENFLPYFEQKLSQNQEKDLEPFFSSLLDLLRARESKNLYDSDISLEYNMGVLEGKPILFDIGNLKKENAPVEKQCALILSYLKKRAPSLLVFVEKKLSERTILVAQEKVLEPH